MTPCDFEQEGFCTLQDEYPDIAKCSKADGELHICTAKEEDLTEFCPDCEQPIEECECGTCWVLVEYPKGHIVPITPKAYAEASK